MTDQKSTKRADAVDHKPGKHKARSGLSRLAMVAAPASAMTFSLFGVMAALIATEYTPAEAIEPREIGVIIPQKLTDETPRTRQPVAPIAPAEAPPPPPALSVLKSDIDLPTPVIAGAAPSSAGFQTVDQIVFSPLNFADRPLQAIRPPLPTYPARALENGIEGECAVQLDVDARGRPFNVEAICTDSVFVRAAIRAVERAEFVPEVQSGQPVERRNVVYPVNFTLAD